MDELPQNISSKNVLLAFDIKTWRNYVLLSLDASDQRFMWMCQFPPLHYLHILRLSLANISLQYKLLGTRSRPMDTKKRYFLFFKENVCSGYSLEAALSNVNDSFTLSRLMKRPKHFVIRHVMSTHNIFSWNIQKAFQQSFSLFNVELRHYSNDMIHMLKFSNCSRRSCEHCILWIGSTFRSTGREYIYNTYPNSFGCICMGISYNRN